MPVVGFVNARTTSAADGSNGHDNLPSVVGAAAPNTAARNVRRTPGFSTGTGAKLLHNDTPDIHPVVDCIQFASCN